MSIRKVSFAFGEFYHVYNRGNSKQKIFHDHEDYFFFIKMLHILNRSKNIRASEAIDLGFEFPKEKGLVSIGAYVLMPNHFHLLITPTEVGDVSKFMQKLCTAYVMYYNKKYNRTGSLFEGKFKSEHLHSDNYLKYIFSYIHLNPVKLIDRMWKEEGIKDLEKSVLYLNTYIYSSYLDYASPSSRKQEVVLDRKAFPDYFPNKDIFQKEILIWLEYKNI